MLHIVLVLYNIVSLFVLRRSNTAHLTQQSSPSTNMKPHTETACHSGQRQPKINCCSMSSPDSSTQEELYGTNPDIDTEYKIAQ